jgi:TatD DNase family protein|tara:strand:+ start:76 stop:837 length:762 start_codon:yes stop_codon:yes gene_type:complete
MIDSHCHLDHAPLLENLNDVLKRSKDVGITKLLTICTTIESFDRIKNIIKIDPIIYGTFGIHPHETAESLLIDKAYIIEQIKQNERIIGIGETGLDFFYNHSNKEKQIISFKNHIEASMDLNMPVIIHSRNAEDETYKILKSYKSKKLKILMHCFTGSLNFANQLLELDAFFSASGIITFKNSLDLQETFKKLPLDKLLVETDSPFLAPIPMRGKKNEPSFIQYTINKLSELKGISNEEIIKATTNNFNNLFL